MPMDVWRALGGFSTFNGAAFFQSGKSVRDLRVTIAFAKLQWSRFFSKRKILLTSPPCSLTYFSFNGAAFFQSGKSSPPARR